MDKQFELAKLRILGNTSEEEERAKRRQQEIQIESDEGGFDEWEMPESRRQFEELRLEGSEEKEAKQKILESSRTEFERKSGLGMRSREKESQFGDSASGFSAPRNCPKFAPRIRGERPPFGKRNPLAARSPRSKRKNFRHGGSPSPLSADHENALFAVKGYRRPFEKLSSPKINGRKKSRPELRESGGSLDYADNLECPDEIADSLNGFGKKTSTLPELENLATVSVFCPESQSAEGDPKPCSEFAVTDRDSSSRESDVEPDIGFENSSSELNPCEIEVCQDTDLLDISGLGNREESLECNDWSLECVGQVAGYTRDEREVIVFDPCVETETPELQNLHEEKFDSEQTCLGNNVDCENSFVESGYVRDEAHCSIVIETHILECIFDHGNNSRSINCQISSSEVTSTISVNRKREKTLAPRTQKPDSQEGYGKKRDASQTQRTKFGGDVVSEISGLGEREYPSGLQGTEIAVDDFYCRPSKDPDKIRPRFECVMYCAFGLPVEYAMYYI